MIAIYNFRLLDHSFHDLGVIPVLYENFTEQSEIVLEWLQFIILDAWS